MALSRSSSRGRAYLACALCLASASLAFSCIGSSSRKPEVSPQRYPSQPGTIVGLRPGARFDPNSYGGMQSTRWTVRALRARDDLLKASLVCREFFGDDGKGFSVYVLVTNAGRIAMVTLPQWSKASLTTSQGIQLKTDLPPDSLTTFKESALIRGFKFAKDGDSIVAVEFFLNQIRAVSLIDPALCSIPTSSFEKSR